MKNKIAGFILGISFPLIIFVSSIETAVFDLAFYREQMEKNQVIETTGIYPPDMDLVIKEILAYLHNQRADFDILARRAPPQAQAGTEKEIIFNEREITHMVDVRNLLNLALAIRNFSIILFLLSFLYLLKNKSKMIIKSLFLGTWGGLVLLICLAGAFLINFQETFIIFHRLFFTNDLWVLDPAQDVLINIVPEPFFIALIGRIITYIISFSGLTIMGTGIYLYQERGSHENTEH